MSTPFQPVPFESLPERPRLPHPFYSLPELVVDVWTQGLGDVPTSVRVVGSGPPLLLLHGLMTTGYSWRYAIEPLSERFTLYIPDLVGAGRTLSPDKVCTPEVTSEWLRALQDRLGILGCDVVGNSMGGYLAMVHALRHPRVVGRLLVVHSPALPEPRLWALWLAMRLPGAQSILGLLVRRDPERWAWKNVHYWDETLKSREETREYGLVLATPDGLRGFYRQLRDMMDVRVMRRFWRSLESRRLAHCDFPIPLSLLYVRQDPMVPPRVGRRLAALVPAASMTWLSEGSHFAHVDATEAFVREVVRAFPQ